MRTTLLPPILDSGREIKNAYSRYRIRNSILHVSGPVKVSLSKDQVIVLCLVKNAAPVINDFIDYYLELGVAHIVFLDNGSTDGTIDAAANRRNVTILKSEYPFKNGGDARLREYLTDSFGFGSWSLTVDIDEYFDFPRSDIISIRQFLGYLNKFNYTAVITQMLDMFPEKLSRHDSVPFERGKHCYYMAQNLVKDKYKIWHDQQQACMLNGSAHFSITGGIRKEMFGASPSLTKHALILRNSDTKRDRWGHFLDRGKVADVSGVLLHYKFTSAFFEQVATAVESENHFNKSSEYKSYYHSIKDIDLLRFPIAKSEKWEGIPKLIDQGIVSSSTLYEQWCLGINYSKDSSAPFVRKNLSNTR